MKTQPPKIAQWLLTRLQSKYNGSPALGDLEEEFTFISEENGHTKAVRWYRWQLIKSIPSCMKHILFWRMIMISNYFKIALRNIQRYKGFSLINILGLSVGLACCILILMWVTDGLSYDNFIKNSDRIYRVNSINHSGGESNHSAGSPSPIGPTLVNDFPEVANFTRVQSGWSGWYLHYGEKSFITEKLCCADPSFFEIFNFEFIQGDPKTALKDRYSVVLTEELAKKCFGSGDAMGQVLQMVDRDMKVTGVIKNIPRNSHLQFDYVFPIINMTEWRSSQIDRWKYTQFATYIQLKENVDANEIENKISAIVNEYDPDSKIELYLQPLKKAHLYSTHINSWMLEYPNKGNIKYIYIFSAIVLCILLVACINFINLTTALSATRIREVGIRKVAGAFKNDLIKQFFGETLLFSLLGLIIGLFIVKYFLPAFNELTGKFLSFDLIYNPQSILAITGIVLLTGIISGSYPALYLSSFKPAGVFKTASQLGFGKGGTLRKILVIGQFSFTIILIFVTFVVYKQLQFIQNKDLGFDHENIVTFASYGQFDENYEAAKNELLQNTNILNVCQAFPPGQEFNGTTDITWPGKDPAAGISKSFRGKYFRNRIFIVQRIF